MRRTSRAFLPAAAWLVILIVAPAALARAADSPSLILVGDTQRTGFWERLVLLEQNDVEREAAMREIAAESPKLVVILGDLVSTGGNAAAWRYFDRFTAPLRSRDIPMVPVMGNHEYSGRHATMQSAVFSRFPALGRNTWAVVQSEGIAVILLNSNFDELTKEQIREQNEWYLGQLATLDKDPAVQFIVVCCHHPPYTNSTVVSPSARVERTFVPAFLAAPKAVLFASGHCHSYEHFERQGKDFLVTGGGGGPRQLLETSERRRRFHDLYDGPALRKFNFCRVAREENHLRITMACLDGKTKSWDVCDEFRVPHPLGLPIP